MLDSLIRTLPHIPDLSETVNTIYNTNSAKYDLKLIVEEIRLELLPETELTALHDKLFHNRSIG